MFKKIALAGLATALLFGAIPAQAGISVNGISINGISVNGVSQNGFVLNGVKLNGVKLNGERINGMTPNQADTAAASRLRVVSVKLPPATR
jgi:hypothetical protein